MANVWALNPANGTKRYMTAMKFAVMANSGWTETTAPEGENVDPPAPDYVTEDELTTALAGLSGGGGGTVVDATTTTKGIAKILGGTATAPTVPWTSVTSKPTIPTGNLTDAADLDESGATVGKVPAVSAVSSGVPTAWGLADVLVQSASKASSDASAGLLDWQHHSATAYLMHLTMGTEAGAATALVALGTDQGSGVGLLVSHKNSGQGISLGQQPGSGMGIQIAARSTNFPLRVQAYAGSAAVSLRASTGAGFADGVATSGSTTFTSATAAFVSGDIGQTLTQLTSRGVSDPFGCIPAGATIVSVGSGTSVTMSAAATASGTGVLFNVDGRAVPVSQNLLIVQDEVSATLTTLSKRGVAAKGQDPAFPPLRATQVSGQTSMILDVRDTSGNLLSGFDKAGHFTTAAKTALTGSDLSNSTVGMYLDDTAGAPRLMLVGKDSAGTVSTGALAIGPDPTARTAQLTTGKYYGPTGIPTGTLAPTQDRLRVHPLYFDEPITIDRIGSDVTTAAASSALRWAIYKDASGYPGALVLDTGAVGDSTTTGWKEATVSQALPAGRYWGGVVPQGGNPTLRAASGSISLPGVGLTSAEIVSLSGAGAGYFINGVSGAAPSTYTGGGAGTNIVPYVWVRKV